MSTETSIVTVYMCMNIYIYIYNIYTYMQHKNKYLVTYFFLSDDINNNVSKKCIKDINMWIGYSESKE